MRFFLFVVSAVLLSSAVSFGMDSRPRYFLVPTPFLDTFTPDKRPAVTSSVQGLNLVQLNPTQVQMLAANLHRTHRTVCGGFLDAQVQMETKGMDTKAVMQWALSRPVVTRHFDKLAPTSPNEVDKVMSMLSQARFGSFLKEFSAFPDRYARSDLGVKAAQWLSERTMTLAKQHNRTDISVRAIPTGTWYIQDSILVRIAGSDSTLPGVLIGGHMDTYQSGKPGADDDGTGSASVMEIYNAVLDSGIKFKRDLYFAYYAAEEWGLYGSQKVVAEFQARKIPMRAVLQFDMTGFKSPNDTQEIYFINDHTDLNLTKFLKDLTQTYVKIPAAMIGDTRCGYSCSDHASWSNAGYSVAFPFEASFANYNKTLHTSEDKMDLVNPAHIMKFIKLGAAFAVETAEPASR